MRARRVLPLMGAALLVSACQASAPGVPVQPGEHFAAVRLEFET